jgi:1-acyl-sn-glycerol-3-phosphate acyltransferase
MAAAPIAVEAPPRARDRLSVPVELPRRWPWLLRRFRTYVYHYLRKHFHGVRLSRSSHSFAERSGPLLIVLNHPSWWDPMICFVLSDLIPNRDQFGAIDAVAIEHYGFFKKLGFVGVDTKSLRGAAEFIRTGTTILSKPDRVYWVTGQGTFTDVRVRPLALAAGVGHLAARLPQGTVVPIALEYTFWNERTPEALVRIGEPLSIEDHPGLSGKEWTGLIERSLTEALNGLNEEASTRDPSRFEELLGGKTGVGGIYDVWRRLKAWLRGRRFDASHDAATRERPL